MSKDPVMEFPVVTEQGFPYGLMCPECKRVIEVGQPFRPVIVSMDDEGNTGSRLQCVYCPPGEPQS
jgi:hypothetical protein